MDLTYQTADGKTEQMAEEKLPPPTYVSMVDPFLVEALQNPRHRLTVLRMELDIQKFLQNTNLQQFEFPHFPTSYLRLAAHRVAQHYGMQTTVQESIVDGQGIRILVTKKPDSKFPPVCLLDVPAKESENDKLDQIKFVIRPRPKASSSLNELGIKSSMVRTVEERKEEYDKARARIFSSSSNSESEDVVARAASNGTDVYAEDSDVLRNLGVEGDRRQCSGEVGNFSRIATFRDREKDRYDPDYDRSYDRYVRGISSSHSYRMAPSNLQNFLSPFIQYDPVFPQLGQVPAPHDYRLMSPYCAMGMGSSHNSGDALYMQWPTHSMKYSQSYDQLGHAFFQASSCQQPLSFDYSQNYR